MSGGITGDHYLVVESNAATGAVEKLGRSTTEWGAVDLLQKAVRSDPASDYAIRFIHEGDTVAVFTVYSGTRLRKIQDDIEAKRLKKEPKAWAYWQKAPPYYKRVVTHWLASM